MFQSFFPFQNRRSFHWFSFIFILQNTIIGLFSAVFRVIIALIVGLLFFMRLDKMLLMKGMEYFDFGMLTIFLCRLIISKILFSFNSSQDLYWFLYLDFTHNNSVLNVFCHILLRKSRKLHQQEIEMGERKGLLGLLTNNKTLNKCMQDRKIITTV